MFGLRVFIAAWVIKVWSTTSSLSLVLADLNNLTRDLIRFVSGFGNANSRTSASLSLINTAVFPWLSFRAGVVLHCKGLVYFRVVQQWFLSIGRTKNWDSPCKNLCQQIRFVFLIVQKYYFWACLNSFFRSSLLSNLFFSLAWVNLASETFLFHHFLE